MCCPGHSHTTGKQSWQSKVLNKWVSTKSRSYVTLKKKKNLCFIVSWYEYEKKYVNTATHKENTVHHRGRFETRHVCIIEQLALQSHLDFLFFFFCLLAYSAFPLWFLRRILTVYVQHDYSEEVNKTKKVTCSTISTLISYQILILILVPNVIKALLLIKPNKVLHPPCNIIVNKQTNKKFKKCLFLS